jgi:Galactose oxidase, central domain
MATTALPSTTGAVRRRTFFGLFDADGWAWAGAKALVWFVIIVTMLGYIPDRAYYFTVGKTVEIWPLAPFLQWSPVNLCPPENQTLPCPAPAGAVLPWQPNPPEVQLPAGRTDGAAAVIGTTYLYVGGTDGTTPKADVYISHPVQDGLLGLWSQGPALPEARASAASVVVGNTLYLVGGYGPDGKPTSTTYSITVNTDGTLGKWTTEDKLALPAPRAASAAVALTDGIAVLGGTDGTAATRDVWKSQTGTAGKLQAWVQQRGQLGEPNAGGFAAHVGDIIYLIGGTNAQGQPTATVELGFVGGPNATAKDPNVLDAWAPTSQNLPAPRSHLAGFVSNGSIYVAGGSDGAQPQTQVLWTAPDANGNIPGWNHLPQTDLGLGLQGAAGVASGANAFLLGGRTASGVITGSARAYLAPQLPFFQIGLLGATVPALKLDGEIGQQIGYLNAATVGAVNFVILIAIGWGFAHKEKVRSMVSRRRGAKK